MAVDADDPATILIALRACTQVTYVVGDIPVPEAGSPSPA
jgi:hypothetical protein